MSKLPRTSWIGVLACAGLLAFDMVGPSVPSGLLAVGGMLVGGTGRGETLLQILGRAFGEPEVVLFRESRGNLPLALEELETPARFEQEVPCATSMRVRAGDKHRERGEPNGFQHD